MLRKLYLSRLAPIISLAMRLTAWAGPARMIYGYKDKVSGRFRKHVRVGSTAILRDRANIAVADHVWIADFCVLDGSNGIEIGEGVQIGYWCGIFTHSSHNTVRLLGRRYIEVARENRPGYERGPVKIGDYTALCSGSMILPGVTIGKGALIAAGAVVAHDVPDFGIVRGNPAKLVGDTRRLDAKFLDDPEIAKSYFAPEAIGFRLKLAEAA
jgi:acetyltransferase-like isoleucine patch superfamily enzyme